MSRLRTSRGQAIWLLVLTLSWAGCSRPGGEQGAGDPGRPQMPFREASQNEAAGLSPTVTSEPGGSGLESDPAVPFHAPRSLPAGTLLTVRLKDPISSNSSGTTTTFAAVVDEAVVIEGQMLVPRGTSVAGRVESARPSTMNRNQGYMRLSLDVVDIGGRGLPIRTTSLFARGKTGGPLGRSASAAVGLEQGRRLTFRLAEPVDVTKKSAILDR